MLASPQVIRTAFFFLLMLSVATTVAAADAEPQAEAAPDATATAEGAAEEAPAEELPPLDCKTAELLETIDSWSVDCVAMWLENLGFAELRTKFTGNKVDGGALKELTMEKLEQDYGVSEEDQRKKIYYNLKDVVRKDTSSGNVNNWSEMFFWCLPFLGIYKWLSLKYEKQIEKAMKKYQKWQDARNPPKPVEVKTYDDGTNEWISGVNGDVGGNTGKKKEAKKTPKSSEKKKKAAKVD